MKFKDYKFSEDGLEEVTREWIRDSLKMIGEDFSQESVENFEIDNIILENFNLEIMVQTLNDILEDKNKKDDSFGLFESIFGNNDDDEYLSWKPNDEEEDEYFSPIETKSPLADIKLLTPKEIVAELNKKVIGQDRAKRVLATEIYKHLLKINKAEEMQDVGKNNIIFAGDSGTGKTFLCETACGAIGLPFEIVDVSSLSDTGYIGGSATDFLSRLYEKTGGNKELAERAIVILDEIDKIVDEPNASKNTNKDVASELLKIVEGSDITFKAGYSEVTLSTRNMLFVGCGAFDGIEDIIAERLNTNKPSKKRPIGFSVAFVEVEKGEKELTKDELRDKVEKEDLIKYGLLRELIGRFPVMVALHSLKEKDLINILKNENGGVVKEYKTIFKALGKTLIVKDNTYDFIAQKALEDKTGARALKGAFSKIMEDYMFNAPSEDKKRYTIDKKYCEKVFEN